MKWVSINGLLYLLFVIDAKIEKQLNVTLF